MAHMFRISFVCNHVNNLVETGKVIILAESHEQAIDLTCAHLNLPPSRTRALESTKLKPSCYVVETHQDYPNARVSMRTQRDPTAPPAPVHRYQVTVEVSGARGQTETQALRKVAEDLQARAMHSPTRHHLNMSINCNEIEDHGRSNGTMARVEMFGARSQGRVNGGSVRGR